ncbi:RNA-binding protein [Thiotrichales bacterium 19S3-7]|nr:RNA-binding protein [Thiotrichales bacterium 19S3-7]MCF6802216.1 RNA-binding protein [Thiotrichales bacterium 19S3-11]
MQNTKVYVGNLSYNLSEADLHDAFGDCGEIQEVKLITDRDTGRSKGFAFITFASEDAVQDALELNGTELDNRRVNVSIAKPQSRTGGSSSGRRSFSNNNRGGYHQH